MKNDQNSHHKTDTNNPIEKKKVLITPVALKRDEYDDEPQKNASRRWLLRAKISVIIIALLIAMAAISMRNLITYISNNGDNDTQEYTTVTVPNLVDLDITQAISRMSDLSLTLIIIEDVYRSDLPSGTVLAQSINAGFVVAQSTVIEVVISYCGYEETTNGWGPFTTPRPHPLYSLRHFQERFPPMSGGHSAGHLLYGGHLIHGFHGTAYSQGIFNAVFTTSIIDHDLMSYIGVAGPSASIFSTTTAGMMGQYGIATFEIDHANRRIIITQVETAYWHDGHPLTLDDILFAHEVIGHPDYVDAGGRFFGFHQQAITGMMAYNMGEADYISGMVLSYDRRKLTIYFDELLPSILYNGVWGIPYPRHIFGYLPITAHSQDYHSRIRPIGWGPFIAERIVLGESIYAVANENFWLGRPYLDSVTTKIVQPEMIPYMMLAGELDIVGFPLQYYHDIPNPDNFIYLGNMSRFYNYVAFNLGDWNPITNSIDLHENPRMSRTLRRAMAYASNESLLTDGLFGGLRIPATVFIPPSHPVFMHPLLTGFPYDPEIAMQILDESGYMVGDNGWRTFPDGSELVIHFVISGEDDLPQIMVANHYTDAWNSIGLNVNILWVDWYEKQANMFQTDNWDWDVTTAAWNVGSNPNPNILWGNTVHNRSRYLNPKLIEYLSGFDSHNAWDLDWLMNHYHAWQELMFYYVPAFPTNWRVNLVAVNNRVENYYIGITDDGIRTTGGAHRIRITAIERYRS